jgi:hypothetical protein
MNPPSKQFVAVLALMAHLALAAGMDGLTGTRHSLMAVLPVFNSAVRPYRFHGRRRQK